MTSPTQGPIISLAVAGPQPLRGNWNPYNRAALESLQQTLGNGSADYDPARPPYAVFDWDNTSVFLDVEDATLVYQLENLALAATPEELEQALRSDLPDDPEVVALVDDVTNSYRWLHPQGAGLKGDPLPSEVESSPQLANFRAKFLHLYQQLEERHGPGVAYPWMPLRFVGMTDTQVRAVTRRAVEWQLKQPIEKIAWTSSKEMPGKAGVVCASWKSGLRLLPEMQSLYRELRATGFDVWVCTASFVEGIRELSSAPEFGYGNPPDRVIGLELERDACGRYLPKRLAGSEITYAKGKTEVIKRLLVPRYGYGPALVAGDSNGDVDMLQDFPETKVSLIIDLKHPPNSPIGKLVARARGLAEKPGSRYLVQQRDEASGTLLP